MTGPKRNSPPGDAEAASAVQAGVDRYGAGDLRGAAEQMRLALRHSPDHPRARLYLGWIERCLRQPGLLPAGVAAAESPPWPGSLSVPGDDSGLEIIGVDAVEELVPDSLTPPPLREGSKSSHRTRPPAAAPSAATPGAERAAPVRRQDTPMGELVLDPNDDELDLAELVAAAEEWDGRANEGPDEGLGRPAGKGTGQGEVKTSPEHQAWRPEAPQVSPVPLLPMLAPEALVPLGPASSSKPASARSPLAQQPAPAAGRPGRAADRPGQPPEPEVPSELSMLFSSQPLVEAVPQEGAGQPPQAASTPEPEWPKSELSMLFSNVPLISDDDARTPGPASSAPPHPVPPQAAPPHPGPPKPASPGPAAPGPPPPPPPGTRPKIPVQAPARTAAPQTPTQPGLASVKNPSPPLRSAAPKEARPGARPAPPPPVSDERSELSLLLSTIPMEESAAPPASPDSPSPPPVMLGDLDILVEEEGPPPVVLLEDDADLEVLSSAPIPQGPGASRGRASLRSSGPAGGAEGQRVLSQQSFSGRVAMRGAPPPRAAAPAGDQGRRDKGHLREEDLFADLDVDPPPPIQKPLVARARTGDTPDFVVEFDDEPQQEGAAQLSPMSFPPPPQRQTDLDQRLQEAEDALRGGYGDAAFRLVEQVVEMGGGDPEAPALRPYQERLTAVYEKMLAPADRIPRAGRFPANLEPHTAFLLSLLDGSMTIEEALMVSGMDRLRAARSMALLLRRGLIQLS